ncbi:hypothetical protein BH20VER1_BH20VER1_09320 [soil metagenome]
MAASNHIPAAHRQRFDEVAGLIEPFGQQHLDAETTGFALELWKRICRRRTSDCLRGKPGVWAASVIQVIARMNFLFDQREPVHLTAETISTYFQVSKSGISRKATEIERTLRLRSLGEPGLCRIDLMEMSAAVRLSNGVVVPWKIAKQLGYLPAETRLEDFL